MLMSGVSSLTALPISTCHSTPARFIAASSSPPSTAILKWPMRPASSSPETTSPATNAPSSSTRMDRLLPMTARSGPAPYVDFVNTAPGLRIKVCHLDECSVAKASALVSKSPCSELDTCRQGLIRGRGSHLDLPLLREEPQAFILVLLDEPAAKVDIPKLGSLRMLFQYLEEGLLEC